jgi:hypothetical protein
MPQSSTSRFVFIGIRIVCGLLFLALVFHDFQLQAWRRIVGDLGLVTIGVCIAYVNRQGRELAVENMRKAGLNPDRDEAQPARKAIDNRSQEK